jgi:exopolysaccharide biosynthesis polyprenyl glycosylphosphotransferase
VSTLYVQAYYVPDALKLRGAFEVSQLVWALFVACNVMLTYASRTVVREALERRWRAGVGLKRVLVAGAGELGRLVADKVLEHQELGFRIVGFVLQQEQIDQLYVALPLEAHGQMLDVIGAASRECVDVRVVPDLLQFIALRARLEDLDGVPIINISGVPLEGFNGALKRVIDIVASVAALVVLALPFAVIAIIIRWTSPGPVFYRQERMGLDGHPFLVFKFRSMYHDAERETGPVWTRKDDPRRTPLGTLLRRFSLDELPQLYNVLRGEMSLVGPRPERPFFVEQFKQRFPQYMLRHKVKSGMTGWAQVNGWRGDTSIEKRIEYDLYYIENWSVGLDLKIMWLTLAKGLFHKHAY